MIDQFFKPATVNEAIELKSRFKDKALFFAGGTEINSTNQSIQKMKAVSIELLGLDRIAKEQKGLMIGCTVTLQKLIDSEQVPEIIKTASKYMVNRNIRNMATIGGNIAANKSCSNLIPVLIVLKAQLKVVSSTGENLVDIFEYINNAKNDLIMQIIIPDQKQRRISIRRFARTANDLSILSAAVSFTINTGNTGNTGKISDPCVAVGGVSKNVVRLTKLEETLSGSSLPDKQGLEAQVGTEINPMDDTRGSAAFKRYLAGVMVADCIHSAFSGEDIKK